MALPKISDIRGLKDEEIAEEILAVKRKLFELRLQKATRRLEKTHEFTHAKHRLAQLLTVESERELSNGTTDSKGVADVTEAIPEPATETEPASVEN
jgi:large subunit ribosomal protein L29